MREYPPYRFAPLSEVEKYLPLMKKHCIAPAGRSKFLPAYRKAGSSRYLEPAIKNKRNWYIKQVIWRYYENPTPYLALSILAWGHKVKGFSKIIQEIE